MTSLTTFVVTAYCACALCTGHNHGLTKSGRPAATSYTLACDRSMLGAIIHFETLGYRQCTDTGGKRIKGNRIDLYIFDHDDAVQFGVQRLKGRVVKKVKP